MTRKKVIFLDSTHPILYEKMTDLGFDVIFDFESSESELLHKISDIEGIIIRSRIKITKRIIDHAPALKFIGRVGSGLENIDVMYAKSKGIHCLNSPEGNRDAVAEHALGMLLCLSNNILKSDKEVREGKWIREENRGIEISGKTIAIIGFGNMGSAFAQRLQGFNCRILSYDKYKKNYAPDYVIESNMPFIFDNADVISFHIPYNTETHDLINDAYIKQYKKQITIINTSRGKILNTSDLINSIESNKVRGACLDVLEFESTDLKNLPKNEWPIAMKKLAKMNNVVLSSHIAGWTHESNIKLSEILANKISDLY